MLQRVLIIGLMAGAVLVAQKPSREIQELQRDVAQLSEEVRTLKAALEQRVSAATSQMETMAKSMTQLNDSVAGIRKNLDQLAQDQDRKLVPLVAAQGSRVDQVGQSLSTMQQAFGDLTSAINRLQTQVVDLGNVVKVISTPAPKPPSAEELLKSADADRLGGKYELAAQGYTEFLRSYADSPQADLAQFQLGMSHYQLKDMESAASDFDAVAKNHPKSAKLPDALFYKAKSLEALQKTSEASAACQELRRRFPRNDFARQCAAPR
jgi:TolA-binding protein